MNNSVLDTKSPRNFRMGPAQHQATKVFDTETFEVFVSRLVRIHLLPQYGIEGDHDVYLDEVRLVGQATKSLSSLLSVAVPEWKLNWRLCKTVIVTAIRNQAAERLDMHEIDDEAREETLERIFREDFESLWPSDWLDG